MVNVLTVKGSKGTRWQVNAAYAPFFLIDQPPDPRHLLKRGISEIVKKSPVRTILSSVLSDGNQELPVVIKIYRLAKLGDWLKANLLGSKGRTEWRVTTAAAERGLRTVIPVAYGERRSGGILRESYLLTVRLFHCITLEEALFSHAGELHADIHTRREITVLLAFLLKQMHDRGIYHQDLHPGNFLVEEAASHKRLIYLLDLHRASVSRTLPLKKRIKSLAQFNMFATISLSNSERLLFFNSYFMNEKQWQRHKRELLKLIDDKTRKMRWRLWKSRQKRCTRINKYFTRLNFAGLKGFARRRQWRGDIGEILLDPVKLRDGGILKKESRSKALWEKDVTVQGEKKKLIIKHYKRKRGWRALKYILRPSQAIRSWRGAFALEMRNVHSVKAIAALERRDYLHRLLDSYFIAEKISGVDNLVRYVAKQKEWDEASREKDIFIQRLALFIRRVHLLGVYHGDMKATNILVKTDADKKFDFILTDLDFIHVDSYLSQRQMARNFLQLNKSFLDVSRVTIRDRHRFLRYYFGPYRSNAVRPMWKRLSRKAERNLKAHRRQLYHGNNNAVP